MNFSRLGLVLVTLGAVALVLYYYASPLNEDLALANFGRLQFWEAGSLPVLALQRWRTPNVCSQPLRGCWMDDGVDWTVGILRIVVPGSDPNPMHGGLQSDWLLLSILW